MTPQAPLPALLSTVPVIPVLRIDDPQRGVEAARALLPSWFCTKLVRRGACVNAPGESGASGEGGDPGGRRGVSPAPGGRCPARRACDRQFGR